MRLRGEQASEGLIPVRAGFVPLVDCAPLVVASRRGFAAEEGIDLRLSRQPSWAAVRDRINVGHLDVAQMLAGMPIASTLGIAHIRVPMIAPFSFGRGGNSIVLSRRLFREMDETGIDWRNGAIEAATALAAVARQRAARDEDAPVLAVVFPFSSHNFELRYWLASTGADPDVDTRLVVIPPQMMVDSLRAGQIDGFCAGEPWGSLAVDAGLGRIVAIKQDIWPSAPEKVLGVTRQWAERNGPILKRLLRALIGASEWCNDPANLDGLSDLLADPDYVAAPRRILRRALAGDLVIDSSMSVRSIPGFLELGGKGTNFPSPAGASWIYSQMVRWGQTAYSSDAAETAASVYCPELLAEALDMMAPLDAGIAAAFIDQLPFDAEDLPAYLQRFDIRRA